MGGWMVVAVSRWAQVVVLVCRGGGVPKAFLLHTHGRNEPFGQGVGGFSGRECVPSHPFGRVVYGIVMSRPRKLLCGQWTAEKDQILRK